MAGLKYLLKNKAFSLLELIIAVAILSIGIIANLQAFSFSARVTGLSCDYINAVFLGENKLQELEFKEKQNLIKEESINDTEGKFNWGYNITYNPDLDLYKLNFRVSWQRLNRNETIDLNSYLIKWKKD